jgi:hypothetical protein
LLVAEHLCLAQAHRSWFIDRIMSLSPLEKHLFSGTMLDTRASHAKTRHNLCEKHYRIEGVYDNIQ